VGVGGLFVYSSVWRVRPLKRSDPPDPDVNDPIQDHQGAPLLGLSNMKSLSQRGKICPMNSLKR